MIDVNRVHLNIRKIRELRNFSQAYIANQLNISTRAYSKIETGETQLTLNRLNDICNILNVTPQEVFGFDSTLIFQNNPINQQGREYRAFNNTDIEQIERLYERLLKEKDEVINLLKKNVKTK